MSTGFAKVIKKTLLGETVEIYQGNKHEDLLKADKDIECKSVLRGKLVDIIDEKIKKLKIASSISHITRKQ